MLNESESYIPWIDTLFQTLLALLALQAGVIGVEGMKVDLVTVGQGTMVTKPSGEIVVLAIREDGRLFLGDQETDLNGLSALPADKTLVLRADRRAPYETVLQCLSCVKNGHRQVVLEVGTSETKEDRP